MTIPQEAMTFRSLQNAIEVGRVNEATIFRNPLTRGYELHVTFQRSEPTRHLKTYRLLSARGEVRSFKSIDAAFRVANQLNLCAVQLVCDPCQEYRYQSVPLESQQSLSGL